MAVCLVAAGVSLRIVAAAFTLAWSHTAEHQPWQEEWRVEDGLLVLDAVRVKGSGAGMEPPAEARLVDGWYVWRPAGETRDRIILRRAGEVPGDWQLCPAGDECVPLGDLVGGGADPVTLYPCP
jgi:hypothetical protein